MRRRDFLETSALATAAWLGGIEARAPTLPFLGEGGFPLERTIGAGLGRRRALDLATFSSDSLLTSEEHFFIRTGCPDRLPPPVSWKLRMHGLVATPLEISIDELRREAADMGAHLLECAGNSRAAHFGLMSVARFSGVALGRLLERVALKPEAQQVLVSGFDEHSTLDPGSVSGASWIFGIDELRAAGAFLATEMNGASLAPDHGYPLRLVVPGWYACTALKWVNEVALVDERAPATDQMREYAGRTHQAAEVPELARDFRPAIIDPAAVPVRVERLPPVQGRSVYRVVGILWGGTTRPRTLRIRFAAEQDYAAVQEIGASSGPWTLWSHTISLAP